MASPENDRTGCTVLMGVTKAAAAEQEGGSVELVGARLDAGLYDSAAAASKLGRGDAGVYLKFFNSFGRGKEYDRIHQALVVIDAIEKEVIGFPLGGRLRDGRRPACGGAGG